MDSVQGFLLVLFLCGILGLKDQALYMCFGIDLSTRVTTNKARGTFLSATGLTYLGQV